MNYSETGYIVKAAFNLDQNGRFLISGMPETFNLEDDRPRTVIAAGDHHAVIIGPAFHDGTSLKSSVNISADSISSLPAEFAVHQVIKVILFGCTLEYKRVTRMEERTWPGLGIRQQEFHALAAPTIAAKRSSFLVLKLELLQELQPACHRGQVTVGHRGRTNCNGTGFKYFGHDLILVCLGDIENLHDGIRTLAVDLLRDLMRDLRGALPHSIVGNGDLVLLIIPASKATPF